MRRAPVLFGLLWLAAATPAPAQTDEIQVYDAQIAAPGVASFALHNNFVASGRRVPGFPGGLSSDHSLNGVAEWAYGVNPWFEAGLYFPLYTLTRDHAIVYNGMKLRALIVTPDAAERAVFYGANLEFSINSAHWDEHRYTTELRPIIGMHVGRFDFVINPILDSAYDGISNVEFAPESRIALRMTRDCKIALEEYADFGRIGHFLPLARQAHELFAVVDLHGRYFDVEAGIGVGLTSASEHRTIKLILMKDL